MTRARLFALALLLVPLDAAAFDKLDGWFIAFERCAAMQSKNKGTNPGGVMTEARRAYDMIGINKKGGDHYQMRVPGAPVTEERWVRADCGIHVVAAGTAPVPAEPAPGPVVEGPGTEDPAGEDPGAEGPGEPGPFGPESDDNLLALSWQPAFCETKPDKSECRRLNAGELPATETQLSMHGLWPQPRGNDYCGVTDDLKRLDKAGRWSDLPAVETDAETRAALEAAMPGTESFLDRHEWIKHGTCHKGAGGADEYYDDALRLAAELNASAVGRFIADNLGREVRTADVAARFDEAFGAGAGDRVEFACARDGGRMLIVEIRIALVGVIGRDTGLGPLMLAARPVGRGCVRGVIDPAGLE